MTTEQALQTRRYLASDRSLDPRGGHGDWSDHYAVDAADLSAALDAVAASLLPADGYSGEYEVRVWDEATGNEVSRTVIVS